MYKVVYLSGPITGAPYAKENFKAAEERLTEMGFIVLNPTKLPKGLTNEQYMRIDFAMLDSADGIFYLPHAERSPGSVVEAIYCDYIKKPQFYTFEALREWGCIK